MRPTSLEAIKEVARKPTTFSPIVWSSVTQAGFIAGVVALILSLSGFRGYLFAAAYFLILIVFAITIFNVRMYRRRPSMQFVEGHDKVFDMLTTYIRIAEDSIWVTRFSKSSINLEHEYFTWTRKIILGENCKRVNIYRRVMNVDTSDKAQMVSDLIKTAGKSTNFSLRKTRLVFFFEILIVDGKYGFIMFHDPGATSIIDSALFIGEREIVTKLKDIYDGIWDDENTEIIKEKPILSQDEIDKIVEEYSILVQTFQF